MPCQAVLTLTLIVLLLLALPLVTRMIISGGGEENAPNVLFLSPARGFEISGVGKNCVVVAKSAAHEACPRIYCKPCCTGATRAPSVASIGSGFLPGYQLIQIDANSNAKQVTVRRREDQRKHAVRRCGLDSHPRGTVQNEGRIRLMMH